MALKRVTDIQSLLQTWRASA